MIELQTSYTFSRIPYITNDALDDYAEVLVADFAPELLNTPGILDAEGFIEYYLGLTIRYMKLHYDHKVLGMTAFNTGVLKIANEKTGLPEPVPVTKGTIILDTSLTATSERILIISFLWKKSLTALTRNTLTAP